MKRTMNQMNMNSPEYYSVKTRHRWNLSLFPSPTSRSLPTCSKNSNQVYLYGQLYWQRRRWSNNLDVIQRIARIVGNRRYASLKLDLKLYTTCSSHPRKSSSIRDPDKWWSSSYQDTGVFRSSKEDVSKVWVLNVSSELENTKWNVLRRVASIFDPLGLAAPLVITGKELLQTLWSRGYEWDDVIEDKTTTKIKAWLDQLSAISQVRVSRCTRIVDSITSFSLITVVDSCETYGAAVYAIFEYEHWGCSLWTCSIKESSCAFGPLNHPWLSTLLRVPSKSTTDSTFNSDSMDVLWWIPRHGKDFRPFVANRDVEVRMHSNPVQWQHSPTTQNPAHLIARGTQVEEFAYRSLWWEGPEWLLQDPTRWPKLDIGSPKDIQERRQKPAVLISRPAPVHSDKPSDVKHWRLNPVHFSSWAHLVRIHARLIRFCLSWSARPVE